MGNTSKLLLMALGGMVLGVTAGVLFAPKSGKETREELAEKINLLKNQMVDLTEKGGDFVADKISLIKEQLAELEKEISQTESS